jgi:hypothetical protein
MSIMPVQVYNKCLHHIHLEPPPFHLKSVVRGRVTTTGRVTIPCVRLEDHKCQNLKWIVTCNEVADPLLCRDWLRVLCPQWKSVLKGLISVSTQLNRGCILPCETGVGYSVSVVQNQLNESNCQSSRQSQVSLHQSVSKTLARWTNLDISLESDSQKQPLVMSEEQILQKM